MTFVISLPRLYAGYTQAIREVLAGGAIGEPTYLRVRVSHDGALPSAANPQGWLPERFFDPRQSAGGVTIDFGAHPLYLLAHLLGMPEEVSAVYGRVTGRAVEDQSVVTMLYPNGARGCGGFLPRLLRALSCGGTRHPRKPPLRSERWSGRAAGAPSDGAPPRCPPTEGRPRTVGGALSGKD